MRGLIFPSFGTWPSADEAMEETLTVIRARIKDKLKRTLESTNR